MYELQSVLSWFFLKIKLLGDFYSEINQPINFKKFGYLTFTFPFLVPIASIIGVMMLISINIIMMLKVALKNFLSRIKRIAL